MAEVEMEVEMARNLGTEGHLDDDLIDYDTDMADHHEPTYFQPGNLEHPDQTVTDPEDITLDTEPIEDDEGQEADAVMSEEVGPGDVEEKMDDVGGEVNKTYDAEPSAEHEHENAENNIQAPTQQLQEAEYVEISHDVEEDVHAEQGTDEAHHTNGTDGDQESRHEIDYELEDPESEEPHTHPESRQEDDVISLNTEVAIEEATAGPISQNVTAELHDTRSNNNDDDHPADENEITYNESGDNDPQEKVGQGNDDADPVGSTENTRNDDPVESQPEVENDNVEEEGSYGELEEHAPTKNDDTDNGEVDEYDVSADVAEEQADAHEAIGSNQVLSAPDQNLAVVSDTEFPKITVQYKGDEFPLFSLTSDGFFNDTSILDETMDKVLSGFREELSNEICHEDELVFQIDELGLEFGESSWRDSLSSVTLRQILEIFDLLVKNQDPDGSQTLYTYLFTKPCAITRLESLIESATAGKGLDEVAHLFQPPIHTATAVLNVDALDVSPGEHLDQYESPVDEADAINETQPEQTTRNSEEGDAGFGASTSVGNQDGQEDHEEPDEGAFDGDHADGHDADDYPEDTIPAQDASEAAQHDEADKVNAHDENESKTYVNLELDDEALGEDAVDFGVYEATEAHNLADPDATVVDTANTSTTATLKEDDETGSIILDISADVAEGEAEGAVEPRDAAGKTPEDLEEIDWRDEPETSDEAPSPLSASGKRARGDDDEVDAEDEQDVKRRRP